MDGQAFGISHIDQVAEELQTLNEFFPASAPPLMPKPRIV
jgi:hypothetical protein